MRHRRAWAWGLATTAALAAGWSWLALPEAPDAPATTVEAAAADAAPPGSHIAGATGPATTRSTPATAAPLTPVQAQDAPPGLSPSQWAALQAELATRPDADAERARLRAYLTWADAVARWRAASDDAALARSVYDGLPDRLAQREVSAPEARLLAAALLQTLQPDPTLRADAQQAFDRALPAPAPPDARQQAFLREQAAVVAAWRASPSEARDPAALQVRLDALRLRHFADAGAATPHSPPQEASR